jgi:hypothetical protein
MPEVRQDDERDLRRRAAWPLGPEQLPITTVAAPVITTVSERTSSNQNARAQQLTLDEPRPAPVPAHHHPAHDPAHHNPIDQAPAHHDSRSPARPDRRTRSRGLIPALAIAGAVILAGAVAATIWALSQRDSADVWTGPKTAPEVRDEFLSADLGPEWSPYTSTTQNGGLVQPEQVRVRAGELQIVGQGNDPTGRGNRSGGLCWCGTGDHRLYGTWRIKARFDAGAGYGPTIGLWPTSNDAQTDGSAMVVSSATPDRNSSWHSVTPSGGDSVGEGSSWNATEWHVYQVDWRVEGVRIQVDDRTVLDTRLSGAGPEPLRKPHDLYLQQDIGPKEGLSAANPQTPNPVIMHVDWVSYRP